MYPKNRPGTHRQILFVAYATLLLCLRSSALTLYVDAARGSDSNDGTAPETALLTLEAAISRTQQVIDEANTIFLSPGIYTGVTSRKLEVSGQALAITSTEETTPAIIDLENWGSFLSVIDGAQATLRNLSVRNGLATGSAAAAIDVCDSSLTIIDCDFKGNLGTGEVIYAENGSLLMQNCLIQGSPDALEEALVAGIQCDNTNLTLLNCTLTGGGTLLNAQGETILNNTIIDGECILPYTTDANNCYAWDNLSRFGNGNLQGIYPALDADGAPLPNSPCISAGNDYFYKNNDLNGSPRSPGAVSIGALEPNADCSSATTTIFNDINTGSFPKPSENSWHSCNLWLEVNKNAAPYMNALYIDCGLFRSFGKNFTAFSNYVRNNVHLTGKCEWETYNPDNWYISRTTATTQMAALATLSIQRPYWGLSTHNCFASQFAAGYYMLPATFHCVEKKSQAVDVIAMDHSLKWTGTAPDNKKCAMIGQIPKNEYSSYYYCQRNTQKRSLILPYAANVPLAVEWTGGDAYKSEPYYYCFDPPDEGALLLTHKKCVSCGAEERLSPMPEEYTRLLWHACLYQNPDNCYDDLSEKLNDGGLREGDFGYIDYYDAGLQDYSYNSVCHHNFVNLGHDTATFRKLCLPYTALASNSHYAIYGDLFANVRVPGCGNAEFTYDAEVIGIDDLLVGITAPSANLTPLTLESLPDAYGTERYILTAREVTEKEADARFRQRRPPTEFTFTAKSTSGDGSLWPTPDDHPLYGDLEDDTLSPYEMVEKLDWRFPRWVGIDEGDALDGDPSIKRIFKRPGHTILTAACYKTDSDFFWGDNDDLIDWEHIKKTCEIITGDIHILLDGKETPMPMLLVNDNNESGVVWPDTNAKADLDRIGPIDYTDSDLKPLSVKLDSTFSSLPAELLDKLMLRIEIQGDAIRVFEDPKKNPLGTNDPRWSTSQNGLYYTLAGMNTTPDSQIACVLYAEGIKEGTATVKATLVKKDDCDADTGISETLEIIVIRAGLAPDYDCDGKIDDKDLEFARKGRLFRLWINNNCDENKMNLWDFEMGGGINCNDRFVNGRGDLLDFFPVWLDAAKFLNLPVQKGRLAIRLRHTQRKINVAYTNLSPADTISYLTKENAGEAFPLTKKGNSNLFCADTNDLNIPPPGGFIQACAAGNGVILCEGNLTPLQQSSPPPSALVLELTLELDGTWHILAERALPTSISDVSEMFRSFNLRGCETVPFNATAIQPYIPSSKLQEPANMPDSETDPLKLYFVHGFNMDKAESDNWMGRLFKRLHRNGIKCRFVGVDWQSNDGEFGCYQWNVDNAFKTAPFLKELVAQTANGDKCAFIAHSLGNMLVSSAIQDWKMQADQFFMLNAAVPAEAYESSQYDSDITSANKMLPVKWQNYPTACRSAEWHSHHPNDNRNKLTWKDRFKDIPQNVKCFNFLDTKDEVIRVISADRISLYAGIEPEEFTSKFKLSIRRLAWQKQEFFKGTNHINVAGGTREAGWGKRKIKYYSTYRHSGEGSFLRPINVKEASDKKRDLSDFSQTVFLNYPPYMDDPAVTQEQQNHLLAYAIPAVSASAGSTMLKCIPNATDLATLVHDNWPRDRNFVLNHKNESIEMPIDDLVWCHSDFMLVPYFYTHELYEGIKRQINP